MMTMMPTMEVTLSMVTREATLMKMKSRDQPESLHPRRQPEEIRCRGGGKRCPLGKCADGERVMATRGLVIMMRMMEVKLELMKQALRLLS